jgi:Protein of unknown function (DUF2695)
VSEILTTQSLRWDEFLGAAVLKWSCQHGHCQAERIMAEMGGIDIKASIAYFEEHGGYCDCEILYNVDREAPSNARH